MTRFPIELLAPAALILAVSCTPASQAGSPSAGQDVLTAEDLAEAGENNLLYALERLRPNWIRPRGAVALSGSNPVVVYVDGLRMGGVSYLEVIAINQVESVTFVDAADAATRWGLNVVGGVIEVTTKPG
jgi:hypothetical protein